MENKLDKIADEYRDANKKMLIFADSDKKNNIPGYGDPIYLRTSNFYSTDALLLIIALIGEYDIPLDSVEQGISYFSEFPILTKDK